MSIGNAWVKEIWLFSVTPGLKNGALTIREMMREQEDRTPGSAVPPGVSTGDCSKIEKETKPKAGKVSAIRSDSDQMEKMPQRK